MVTVQTFVQCILALSHFFEQPDMICSEASQMLMPFCHGVHQYSMNCIIQLY